jgi:transcription elongation factor GreA
VREGVDDKMNTPQHELLIGRTYLLTPQGFAKKKARLHYLCTLKRKEIADYLHEAKQDGSLHENSAYDDAKQEQARVEQEILELEHLFETATVMTEDMYRVEQGPLTVRIGTQVTVESDTGTPRMFKIVETCEAEPTAGFISDQSPVGKALMGHRVGDEVHVVTPGGTLHYRIRDVTTLL